MHSAVATNCEIHASSRRVSRYNGERMLRYLPSTLRPGQVLLLNVTNLIKGHERMAGMPYAGGGFIGGDAEAVDRWNRRQRMPLGASSPGSKRPVPWRGDSPPARVGCG